MGDVQLRIIVGLRGHVAPASLSARSPAPRAKIEETRSISEFQPSGLLVRRIPTPRISDSPKDG
jgi:hypothetical protein